jgi:hypothetical protein
VWQVTQGISRSTKGFVRMNVIGLGRPITSWMAI